MNRLIPRGDRGCKRTSQSRKSEPAESEAGSRRLGGTQKALSAKNVDLARKCLGLVREIADRGAGASDPYEVAYALEELRQVLSEAVGFDEPAFMPESATEIPALEELYRELFFGDAGYRDLFPHD
jgi:hypothetical protein